MAATTNFKCQMCGNETYETGEIRAAGGFWSKIFDVQGKKFATVTCLRCKHTDLYKTESSRLENIFDLFTN